MLKLREKNMKVRRGIRSERRENHDGSWGENGLNNQSTCKSQQREGVI